MRTRNSDKGSSSTSGSPTEKRTGPSNLSPSQPRRSNISKRSSSNQSSQSDHANPETHSVKIRAFRRGSLLIITGLNQHQFPAQSPNWSQDYESGRKPRGRNGRYFASTNDSPIKRNASSSTARSTRQNGASQRPGLKRKHSALYDGAASEHDVPLASQELADDETGEAFGDSNAYAELSHLKVGNTTDTIAPAYTSFADSGLKPQDSTPAKRRRRGKPAHVIESVEPSRAPSPELPTLGPEEDLLNEVDLPDAFRSESGTPDPDVPDDEAHKIYQDLYKPLPKPLDFTAALTRFNTRQRSSLTLYALAENTAAALRAWQDEYLLLDKLTAPHAPIPRKPANGNRQPLSPTAFEDLKEADIYDYIYDPKKPGRQDAIAQRVIRDPSGRELRQRYQRGRVGADGQLVVTASAGVLASEDEGERKRTRKPVSKYDGILPAEQHRRKRGLGALNEALNRDQPAKRGRVSVRGGGRGRGFGRGRGGLGPLGKRIRQMREESGAPMGLTQEDGEPMGSVSDSDGPIATDAFRDGSASVQVCLSQ